MNGSEKCLAAAYRFGNWLLAIQDARGYWAGGLHPPKEENPSVFNTGQILFGLLALYEEDKKAKWCKAAVHGARWLADNVNKKGLWEVGHYHDFNPTYYSRAAWPMLLTAETFGESYIREQAVKVLDHLMQRKTDQGTFRGWGFKQGKPAFTHTIAYTIRGFLEASLLLEDWQRYGLKIEPALDKLYTIAELQNGRLTGEYDLDWDSKGYYSCLTGNVQVALCLMRWHQQSNDLRLLNAASKLINYVPVTSSILPSINGAVGGSKPLFGRYIPLRYPNWAAKFYADAAMLFITLMNEEKELWRTAAS
jgi:hypothetical protein